MCRKVPPAPGAVPKPTGSWEPEGSLGHGLEQALGGPLSETTYPAASPIQQPTTPSGPPSAFVDRDLSKARPRKTRA